MSELSTKIKPNFPQLEIINLLRGIAAFSVAWFHFTNGNSDFLDPGLIEFSGKYGYLGVEVFFVISGFIIPYSLDRSKFKVRYHWKTFLAKRLVRLHPAYLAAIILTISLWYLSSLHPSFRGSPPDLDFVNILLHIGYLNGIFNQPWISPVFWTLGIEFQYYLLILVIYPLFSSRSQALNICAYLLVFCFPLMFVHSSNLVFHWLNLFGFGIISFQLFSHKINILKYSILTVLMTIFSWIVLGWLNTLVGVLTSILIIFVKIPKVNLFSLLGDLSYSFYLIHVPIGGRVISLGSRITGGIAVKLSVLVSASTLSLIASYLMYKLIEKPTQSWSKSIRYQSNGGDESQQF